MAESVSGVREREDFSYAIRDFLDRFQADPNPAWLEEEPNLLAEPLRDDGLADAYVAAVAAHMAQERWIPCPPWANRMQRVKKTPWFAAKTLNLKAILIQESPAAFRVRNLFVSANALSRA